MLTINGFTLRLKSFVYDARADIDKMRELAGSDEEFRNLIWRLRDPEAHTVHSHEPGWPAKISKKPMLTNLTKFKIEKAKRGRDDNISKASYRDGGGNRT